MARAGFLRRLFCVGELPTARLAAFSDGVFAVAVTLLVLEVHVPQASGPQLSENLLHGLLEQAPKFFSYALSFMIICIWWVAHHHLLDLVRRTDRGLLWLNSLFLLCLAFVPFPTAMMGDYPRERVAVMFYGAVTTAAGICFACMRFYVFYVGRLVGETLDRRLMRGAMLKSAMNPLLHAAAVLLALVDTRLAMVLYTLLPLTFIVPSALDRHGAGDVETG
jgi:uncharacterized membrane protein